MNRFLVLIVGIAMMMLACQQEQNVWEVSSPNATLKFSLSLHEGFLSYQVFSGSDVVIQKSMLGIIREDADLSSRLSFVSKTDVTPVNKTIELITGKQVKISDHSNVCTFTFKNENGQLLGIEVKVLDNDLAFRYLFPETSGEEVTVLEEMTEFNLSAGGEAWLQPYDLVSKYTPAYEMFYQANVPIGEKSPTKNGWCFPALFSTAGHYILLSDAGIDGDYPGMHLEASTEGIYKMRWPEVDEGQNMYHNNAKGTLPYQTSWRTFAISKDYDGILKSDIVKIVSPERRIEDVEWIKPGRASWSWLSDHDSPQDYDKLVKFVDLAVNMGWEYSLVDANWNVMKGGTIEQLVEYANSKGVGILMWYNSGGAHNIVTEMPRDRMFDPEVRRKEFARLQEMGVKGVKIDFFQTDKQTIMEQYKGILEDAAAHHILVNFHGCAIPRGWSRTYPNMMSMESVRGAENYTFSEPYPDYAPIANTILPFTRNVVGSMDYTPVIFTNMQYPHITTYGHELALSILFESGWVHMADAVEGYMNLPEAPKKFLMNVPVTWDEIKYVYGTPGKDAVLARRKGEQWYIAGINGENQAKEIELGLSFTGKKPLKIIADGETSETFSNLEYAEGTDKLIINMLPYGGFVAFTE